MTNKSIEGNINFSNYRFADHDEIDRQYKEAEKEGVLSQEKTNARIEKLKAEEVERKIKKAMLEKVFGIATDCAKNF